MSKFNPISGFPEWLPEQRLLEQQCQDIIRKQYELYGFANIETRSVEPISVLTGNGDDKEIYVLGRLQEDETAAKEPAEFGLRFDLTVPTARYVQQFKGQLAFPFKRYQMQKVWRGERPQEGRYREFTQCDIDVIGDGELPSFYDAEVVRLLAVVTSQLPIPPVTIRVNNRKILQGFYQAVGINDTPSVLRIMDKIDKVGEEKTKQALTDLGLNIAQITVCTELAKIKYTQPKTKDAVSWLNELRLGELVRIEDDLKSADFENKETRMQGIQLADEGIRELIEVLSNSADLNEARAKAGLPPAVMADHSIARGLAYYTGMVCEGQMQGFESSGSVCGGGRYDNLASDAKVKLPGVGVSIGLTRILGLLFAKGELKPTRKTPTEVLVALNDDASRAGANSLANQLRARGIATDTYHAPKAFGKQIEAASKRGIPYIWFMGEGGTHQVKNLTTGEQTPADPATWQPQ
jgi:histidyl-tRNA synthetase